MVKVIKENGIVKVSSSYNKHFVQRARELKGKWVAQCWEFQEEYEELVRAALLDIYGEAGVVVPTVKVEIDLDVYNEGEFGKCIYLDKMLLVSRKWRDYKVTMEDNVIVVKGGFPESGGSAKNPCVAPEEGTVLSATISKHVYEKVKDLEGVRQDEERKEDKVNKLFAERAGLLKRLGEIRKELEGYGIK